MMLLSTGCAGGKPMPCTTSGGICGAGGGTPDAGAGGHAGSLAGKPGSVAVKVDTMVCPPVSMTLVAPHAFDLNSPSPIAGSASDDAGDEFSMRWSASAGHFENRTNARTIFTCTEPGVQTLTLLATSSESCSEALAVAFSCL
jgi:hypothetical protein